MHPWYVLWLVPFLCVRSSPAALFFTGAVTLSYVQYLVDPPTLPAWAWLAEYGTLYALLLREWRAGRLGLEDLGRGRAEPEGVGSGGPAPAAAAPAGPGRARLDAGSPGPASPAGPAGATLP